MMSATKHQRKPSSTVQAHLNELLDEALNETFPASDPIAIAVESEPVAEISIYNTVKPRFRSEAAVRR
jgi:hypothetical protein